MSHEIFTDDWANAWADELRASDAYRAAAAGWEGSIALQMSSGDVPAELVAVFLDLWHGDCRAARRASTSDLEQATFVIRAGEEVWRRVLERDLEPIFGLMSGKLDLARGSLARLMPYVTASRELVAAATRSAEPSRATPPSEEPELRASTISASPRTYQTTSQRGLDRDHPAMRLWAKAKRLGVWNEICHPEADEAAA